MIYDKHTEKLLRIQFREQLCSFDSAQHWLTAKRRAKKPPIDSTKNEDASNTSEVGQPSAQDESQPS